MEIDAGLMPLVEFPRFLELPKDLHKKFMDEYFYPLDALTCLRVSKLLKELADVRSLQIRVVKCIAYEKQMVIVNDKKRFRAIMGQQIILCTLCTGSMQREQMPIHLLKHKQGRILNVIQPPREPEPEFCKLCNAPYPNIGPHDSYHCPLDPIICMKYRLVPYYPWAELLCHKAEGFRKEMIDHDCAFRCRKCLGLFSSDAGEFQGSGLDYHLRDCKFKEEIDNEYTN